jgi:hypothetical protein
MPYWIKRLGHWWGYVSTYITISVIGTAILGYFVASDPDGLSGLVQQVMSKRGNPKGEVWLLALIFLGPLFNVYTAIISSKCAVEADDDCHWSLKTLTHLEPPSPSNRKMAIAVLTFVPGLLFLPFTFWMYTDQVNWLWKSDTPINSQLGTYISIAIVLIVYVVVPKVFPSAVDAAFELEDKVTDRLTPK